MLETRIGERVVLRAYEADVFDVPADALVFGRNPELRRRIEERSGRAFAAAAWAAWHAVDTLESAALPWPRAASVRYHPRDVDPLAPRRWITHVPHALRLYAGIDQVATSLGRDAARHLVIVPFSWRHPQVMGAAVSAWTHLVAESSRAPLRIDVVALDGIDAIVPWLQREIRPGDLSMR